MYKETAHDLDIKYSDTYIGYKEDGKKIVYPMRVSHAQKDGSRLLLIGQVLKNRKWYDITVPYKSKNLIFDFPQVGCINMYNSFIVMRRSVKKQYRKTLNKQTVEFFDPFSVERMKANMQTRFKLENKFILKRIFNQVFPSMITSYRRVASGKYLGSAFNRHWGFGISARNEKILLFRDGLAIGEMMSKSEVKIPEEILFLKESIEDIGLGVVV